MVETEQTSHRDQDRLDVLLHVFGALGDVFWDAAPLHHHVVVRPVADGSQQIGDGIAVRLRDIDG